MLILYTTYRVELAYFCRAPEVYDNKMNKSVIKALSIAPLLYMAMGAWLYSNQQTFIDSIEPVMQENLFPDPDHYFEQFWEQLTPGTVFFVYLFVVFTLFVTRIVVKKCKIERCYSNRFKVKNIEMRQKLANFFSALKPSQRASLIREEVVDYKRLNSSKLDKERLAELVLAPEAGPELKLTGEISYRILRHSLAEQFNFFQHEKNSRQVDFVISEFSKTEYKRCSLDVVNAVAYMPFLDPEEVKTMEFTLESMLSRHAAIQKQ